MKQNTKILLNIAFLAFLVVVSGYCVIGKVYAQQKAPGYNIEVSPIKVNREIQPGRSFTQTFRVGNYSGKDQTIYIYVQDFAVSDELGAVSFLGGEKANAYALSKWVRVLEPKIFVKNGTVKETDVVIDVPFNAEAGGHYGAVFFQTEEPSQVKKGGATVSAIGRVASFLLVSVPGDVTEKIVLTSFFPDKKVYWDTNPSVKLISFVKNEGNIHAVPTGVMFLQGGLNYRAENVIYNQTQGAVLPDSPARKIVEEAKIERDGFVPVMGKIHVNLLARYGRLGQEISGTTSFWVIPVKFLTIVLFAVLIALFVSWRVYLSFKKERR